MNYKSNSYGIGAVYTSNDCLGGFFDMFTWRGRVLDSMRARLMKIGKGEYAKGEIVDRLTRAYSELIQKENFKAARFTKEPTFDMPGQMSSETGLMTKKMSVMTQDPIDITTAFMNAFRWAYNTGHVKQNVYDPKTYSLTKSSMVKSESIDPGPIAAIKKTFTQTGEKQINKLIVAGTIAVIAIYMVPRIIKK